MATDDDVDRLLADASDEVARATRRLREVIREGQPDMTEAVRTGWRSINYRDSAAGFVCALFPYADRVDLVFEHGARLPDPDGRLTGTTRQVRTLRIPAGTVVEAEVVVELLDAAVELGAGLRARRR